MNDEAIVLRLKTYYTAKRLMILVYKKQLKILKLSSVQ